MKITRKILLPALGVTAFVLLILLVLSRQGVFTGESIEVSEEPIELLYGIPKGEYTISEGEIASGETLGQILGKYGIGPVVVDQIARLSDSIFPVRNLRAGHTYTVFQQPDSTSRLDYFVYEATVSDYLVIDLTRDTINIHMAEKEVIVQRVTKSATISSSLWNSMISNDMSPAMAMELSDIYAWSIDFFALQKEDKFTVIYDERFIDSTSVGIGTIWGAEFQHSGKTYYAVPFMQNGKIGYWDENGNSLRKNILKAPLKFSRISSKFSNSRLHPVLRIRRPHHGVDYAAASGTPVVAVGDGVVVFKGYAGGGGNTLKIKHNSGSLVSGYLHLKAFAKGLKQGSRVSQGELIGYVGSTGLSTGPHLDFRIWQSGKPIDPLKVPSEPAEPIKAGNKAAYMEVKDRVLSELRGELADSLKVRTLDETLPAPAQK